MWVAAVPPLSSLGNPRDHQHLRPPHTSLPLPRVPSLPHSPSLPAPSRASLRPPRCRRCHLGADDDDDVTLTQGAANCPPGSAWTALEGGRLERRHVLSSMTSAMLAGLFPCDTGAAWAQDATSGIEASEGSVKATPQGESRPAASRKPASQTVDFTGWSVVYGEAFALRVPPGFVDIMPPPEEDTAPMSTVGMQNKAQKTPFIAKYASEDGVEQISVVLQPATKVKLTFFEVDDISEFGSIDEAAKLFVSPGAKILARREFTATWPYKGRPRTYYLYEYVSGGSHITMSVAASAGYVFVMGASTPADKWRPATAARLRAATGAFQLTV